MSSSLNDKLILGTVQLGLEYGINNTSGKPSAEESFRILDAAYDGGVRRLDTAEAYGNSQEVIGMYHRKSSKKFRVITKYSSKTVAPNTPFRDHVRNSMSTLHVDKLEAYMFHSFGDYQSNAEALKSLRDLKGEGLIEKIGVSVYTNSEVESVLDNGNVDLIQLPFNVLDNVSQRGAVLERARSLGVEIHVRSVFLQGLFMKKRATLEPPLSKLLPYLQTLDSIASGSNKPVEAIALNYDLQSNLIDGVLFGVETLDQLKENLRLVAGYKLSDDEMNTINNIRVKEVELLNPVNWKQPAGK